MGKSYRLAKWVSFVTHDLFLSETTQEAAYVLGLSLLDCIQKTKRSKGTYGSSRRHMETSLTVKMMVSEGIQQSHVVVLVRI